VIGSAAPHHSLPALDLVSLQRTLTESVQPEHHYEQCRARGVALGPSFRILERLFRKDGEALGVVRLPDDSTLHDARFRFNPVLMDGCLQVLAAAGLETRKENIYLPLSLGRMRMLERPPGRLWSYARIRPLSGEDAWSLTVDFQIFSDDGNVVATCE